MLKKTLILFTALAIGYGIFHFKNKEEKIKSTSIERGWKKFQKKDHKTSFTHAKTIDLEQHKIKPKAVRKPASRLPMRAGRILEGQDSGKFTSPDQELKFSNRVNPKWKETLGHNLTRFQPEGTEVLIKKEKAMIYIHKGNGQYREQVLISYKLPDGRKSSYRAMIDSSNGKILYTFNRQKNEYFRNRPAGFTHPLAQ